MLVVVFGILLGKEPYDWDIATSATPEEIKRYLEAINRLTRY